MKREYDEYPILPDEELREIYMRNRRNRRLFCLPMVPLVYFIGSTVSVVVSDLTNTKSNGMELGNWFFLLSLIAAFVGCSFVLAENPVQHKRLTLYALSAQVVFIEIRIIVESFSDTGSPHLIQMSVQIALTVFVGAINYFAHSVILQHQALTAHPRYPFDNWRRDENYIHRATGDEVLQIIDNSMNKGKVKAVGHEEFFGGEAKPYEPPKPDPEKNLQQRKQVWRHHDKSDTAYSMDNLKNMYLGKPEEGELSGAELEKELWKATAPKKPKEPPPEEFFQQTPVIWRTNKDGTTTLERRAPGSAPAGERESRNVLM